MNGSEYSKMADGLYQGWVRLIITLGILSILGLWKAVELIIAMCKHLKVTVT